MDRLTPLDIERMQFPKALRGYQPEAVREALARASSELEQTLRELKDARKETERMAKTIAVYRDQEDTITESLKLAQRTADETRATAHKEADLILEHARRQAEAIVAGAEKDAESARWELEKLRAEKRQFLTRTRAALNAYLEELGSEGNAVPQPKVEASNGVRG